MRTIYLRRRYVKLYSDRFSPHCSALFQLKQQPSSHTHTHTLPFSVKDTVAKKAYTIIFSFSCFFAVNASAHYTHCVCSKKTGIIVACPKKKQNSFTQFGHTLRKQLKMAKVISQETFDDVVKENVVEFSMNVEEAKQETVQQFEAQGINLSNIIKDLSINEATGRPVLNETIDQLKEISFETSLNGDEVPKLLEVLTDECVKSIPHRVVNGWMIQWIHQHYKILTDVQFNSRWRPN